MKYNRLIIFIFYLPSTSRPKPRRKPTAAETRPHPATQNKEPKHELNEPMSRSENRKNAPDSHEQEQTHHRTATGTPHCRPPRQRNPTPLYTPPHQNKSARPHIAPKVIPILLRTPTHPQTEETIDQWRPATPSKIINVGVHT